MEGDRRPGPPPFPSRVDAFLMAFAQEADVRERAVVDIMDAFSK